ncbi:MAG: hypothetical protein KDK53_06210 [Maritimibacter sp.]|nr:hypothetical protein [Maritimibacter sp.]
MVRPYEVSEPFLFGDVDSDVLAFAQEKFASLARGVISRMQRWEASGIFEGEAEGLRSLWDEWCWYQANHSSNTPLLSYAIDDARDGVIAAVVSGLTSSEAVLLTKAAAADEADAQCANPELLGRIIADIVSEAASRRDLSRFEVY